MPDPVTNKAEEPADDRLTEIVSYLDAELDATQMNAVELRLGQDSSLREFADSLDRTWQLLDALEEVSVSDQFTRKTLDSIATLADQQEATDPSVQSRRSGLSRIRWQRIVPWFLAGVVGAGLGLLLSQQLQARRADTADTAVLQDLNLLRNYPRYRVVPDAAALRQLQLPEPTDADQEPQP